MPVYCCRWRSGDISFVSARNKKEAVDALDEHGNAETSDIFEVPEFMLHMRLEDNGKFSFHSFGEVAHFEVMTEAYPLLGALLQFARPTPSQVRQAVREERSRLKRVDAEKPAVREQPKKRVKNA